MIIVGSSSTASLAFAEHFELAGFSNAGNYEAKVLWTRGSTVGQRFSERDSAMAGENECAYEIEAILTL